MKRQYRKQQLLSVGVMISQMKTSAEKLEFAKVSRVARLLLRISSDEVKNVLFWFWLEEIAHQASFLASTVRKNDKLAREKPESKKSEPDRIVVHMFQFTLKVFFERFPPEADALRELVSSKKSAIIGLKRKRKIETVSKLRS